MHVDPRAHPACVEVVNRLGAREYSWILWEVEEARGADALQGVLLRRVQQRGSGRLDADDQLRSVLVARQLVVAVLLTLPGVTAMTTYGVMINRVSWAVNLMRQIGVDEIDVVTQTVHPRDAEMIEIAKTRLQGLRIGGRWLLGFDRELREARAWYVPLIGGLPLDFGPLQQVSPFRFTVSQ